MAVGPDVRAVGDLFSLTEPRPLKRLTIQINFSSLRNGDDTVCASRQIIDKSAAHARTTREVVKRLRSFSHEQAGRTLIADFRGCMPKPTHNQSNATQCPPKNLFIPPILKDATKARQSVPVSSSCQIDRIAPRGGPMFPFGEMTRALRIWHRTILASKHFHLFAPRLKPLQACNCVL